MSCTCTWHACVTLTHTPWINLQLLSAAGVPSAFQHDSVGAAISTIRPPCDYAMRVAAVRCVCAVQSAIVGTLDIAFAYGGQVRSWMGIRRPPPRVCGDGV